MVAENPSIVVARDIVSSLISSGVRHVAYCPGSRDAPFAYALAAAERAGVVNVATFGEERGAGFWAVGAAKAGVGAAVITTSGTAAAELHPALEEAYFQGLPVVAVTADRPHEMRGVGASQTTHQDGIFGCRVVSFDSLPALEVVSEKTTGKIRHRVARLVGAARGFLGQAGPVHLNVGFRDPLVPASNEIAGLTSYYADLSDGTPARECANVPDIRIAGRVYPAWSSVVSDELRTIVVAGDGTDRSVAEMASTRGIPVLAEPSSGVTASKSWIPYEQWIVGMLADQVQQVIVTGRPTLSRPIGALLARADIRKVIVASHREWVDVAGTASVVVEGLRDTDGSDDRHREGRSARSHQADGWLHTWRQAAEEAGNRAFSKAEESSAIRLSLLTACRAIWEEGRDCLLWLGASNTIRGFDLTATAPGRDGVFSNRGLAGIDGTIASALGLAMASTKPVRAVMGDMTFAYDLATLVQRPEGRTPQPDIQVIVLDDGGGSIFASLEHGGAEPDVYERYFAVTPHLDVCAAAEAAGWTATSVSSLAELVDELRTPIHGRSVLHVKIPWPADEIAAARAGAQM